MRVKKYAASYGFDAAEGWDPTTGLGYINYPNMFKAIMDSMPPAAVAESAGLSTGAKIGVGIGVVLAAAAIGFAALSAFSNKPEYVADNGKAPFPVSELEKHMSQN